MSSSLQNMIDKSFIFEELLQRNLNLCSKSAFFGLQNLSMSLGSNKGFNSVLFDIANIKPDAMGIQLLH